MEAGKCFNRAESSLLNDTTKSLVLVNYFPTIPVKLTSCLQNSMGLTDMLNTCYIASDHRWANFVAVNYYKVSNLQLFRRCSQNLQFIDLVLDQLFANLVPEFWPKSVRIETLQNKLRSELKHIELLKLKLRGDDIYC